MKNAREELQEKKRIKTRQMQQNKEAEQAIDNLLQAIDEAYLA
jgi:hypothetical protein